jgi:chromosome partitioning protein
MEIAVLADKGGVGKSLLAAHIAGRLAQLGRRTTLIDLDHRCASSRHLARANAGVRTVLPESVQTLPDPQPDEVYVWDTRAHPSDEQVEGLAKTADLSLIVADNEVEGLRAAVSLSKRIEREGGRAVLLLNNVNPGANANAVLAELREVGAVTLNTAVRRYACYAHARNDGRLVCDYPYSRADDAWADIIAVTAEIEEVICGREVRAA